VYWRFVKDDEFGDMTKYAAVRRSVVFNDCTKQFTSSRISMAEFDNYDWIYGTWMTLLEGYTELCRNNQVQCFHWWKLQNGEKKTFCREYNDIVTALVNCFGMIFIVDLVLFSTVAYFVSIMKYWVPETANSVDESAYKCSTGYFPAPG
jgi:hypothetical protein